MLTMQTPEMKRRIVGEARRLLRVGGRYGIHEMCLTRDDIDDAVRKEIQKALAGAVHHGVRPLTPAEWRTLLESEGFEVHSATTAPMALLEPRKAGARRGHRWRSCGFSGTSCATAKAGKGFWRMRHLPALPASTSRRSHSRA